MLKNNGFHKIQNLGAGAKNMAAATKAIFYLK